MKKFCHKYRCLFYVSVVCIVVTSAIQISLEFVKGTLLDHAANRRLQQLILAGALLLTLVFLKAFTHFLYTNNFKRFTAGAISEMRSSLFESILSRSFPRFIKRTIGDYLSLYTNRLDVIERSCFESVYGSLQIITETIFAFVGLTLLNWKLALTAAVLLVPPVFVPGLLKKYTQNAQKLNLRALDSHLSHFTDWIRGFEVIHDYGVGHRILRRFSYDTDELKRRACHFGSLSQTARTLSTLLTQLSLLGIVTVAGFLLARGKVSVGMFFTAVGIMEDLQSQVIYQAGYIQEIIASKVSLDTVNGLINESDDTLQQRVVAVTKVNRASFEHVCFSYPDSKERALLTDLCIDVKKKGVYWVRGESGCGKSTAMNLLMNYYPVSAGSIKLNGVNVETISNLPELITVMRQESFFFEDTLRNNLAMYRDLSDEEITDCMKQLGLEKYASSEALDCALIHGAERFSGGEARRLSLARSLLRPSDILILDEPLANLDSESIKQVENCILGLENRIVFLISHQASAEMTNKVTAVYSL